MKFIFSIFTFIFAAGQAKAIIHGTPGFHPRVGTFKAGDGYCKGFLIEPQIVVTAAHCKFDILLDTDFVLQDRGGEKMKYAILNFKRFENYDSQKSNFGDIAVIFLKTPVKDEPSFKKIKLVESLPATDFIGIFFGAIHRDDEAFFSLKPDEQLAEETENLFKISFSSFRIKGLSKKEPDHFLLESVSENNSPDSKICHGDSGGPYLLEGADIDYLIGISSYISRSSWNVFWGKSGIKGVKFCKESEAVITSAVYHYTWLTKTIASLKNQYSIQ